MPMTELLTCSVTPTYGPTRRNATISRTSTAPAEACRRAGRAWAKADHQDSVARQHSGVGGSSNPAQPGAIRFNSPRSPPVWKLRTGHQARSRTSTCSESLGAKQPSARPAVDSRPRQPGWSSGRWCGLRLRGQTASLARSCRPRRSESSCDESEIGLPAVGNGGRILCGPRKVLFLAG
jgi:hypothetical protein